MQDDLPALIAAAQEGDPVAYAAIADRLEEMGRPEMASWSRSLAPDDKSFWPPGLGAAVIGKKCRECGLIP
jgi:hypothetical protein